MLINTKEDVRGPRRIGVACKLVMVLQGVQLVTLGGAGRTYEVDEWADLQLGAREQYAKPALDAILTDAQHVHAPLSCTWTR